MPSGERPDWPIILVLGGTPVIAVGIDVGKRTHEACFLGADGREVARPLRFANTAGGVRLLLERLQALAEPATIALEASGHSWLPLQRCLAGQGLAVQVLNPLPTDSLRGLGVRKAKTDRRDAVVVADLVRIGRARPNDTILQLRELTRFRWRLVDQIGDAKRRALGVLDRVFPEFADQFSDPFGTSARELLERAASAAEFAALDLDELTTLLERASRKRCGRASAWARPQRAADSLGLAALGPAARLELRALLAQIALLEQQVAEADAAIAARLGQLDPPLSSIPGVGPVLAATILAEIGAIERFPRFQALVAYAGLDPRVFASGPFQGRRQHRSKRGSPSLRRARYLATHSAHRRNPDLDAYLQRKLAEGKPYTAALVATARKLLARIDVVLKEGRPFTIREATHDH